VSINDGLVERIREDVGVDPRSEIELKISLLSKGLRFPTDLFAKYEGEFYANQYVYGNTSRVNLSHRVPQVLLLGEGVISAVLRREDTPWTLDIEDGEVRLSYDDDLVRTLDLPEVPAYFGKTLIDGTRAEDFISVAGEDTPGYFIFPECYYFDIRAPCGFCSLKGTRKSVAKKMATTFYKDRVTEATKLFQNTPWRDIPIISFTAGTALTDDETREHIIDPIRFTYEALDPKIPIHALVHPPHDFKLIDEYKQAGATTIAFNIEIYDRELFKKICPGKDKEYGYDKWMEAVEYAREVFGDYKVFCGLVWGLEPPESTMEGNVYFAERRIAIASNIFHNDPKSVLQKHPHPSEADILRIGEIYLICILNIQTATPYFQ
jgi:bacteriochlorophyllide c C-7(1)-hydroxylase